MKQQYMIGARMARELARSYRSDAMSNSINDQQRHYLELEAKRADDRAEWYEDHAELFDVEEAA